MSYERLIHQYFDADLSEPEKEALFAKISQDQALRAEFDNQLKIHLIAQADMNAIVPPVDIGNRIFSKLGIPLTVDKINNQSILSGKLNSMTRFLPILLTIFFTFTLTVALLKYSDGVSDFLLGEKFDESNFNSINFPSPNQNVIELNAQIEQSNNNEDALKFTNVDVDKKFDRKSETLSQMDNQKEMQNSIANQVNIIQYASKENKQKNEIINLASLDNKISDFQFILHNKSINLNNFNIHNINLQTPSTFNLSDKLSNKFEIRVRQLASTNNIKFDKEINDKLSEVAGSMLPEGYAIASYYRINENQSLGIEFGNERFPQIFELAGTGKYYQNPEIFWIGIGYKLDLPQLSIAEILYPYTQMEACYTTIGPIFRPQIGFVLKPIKDLTVFAGYEAAILLYNVDGTIYNSSKYGLIYGFSFHF